MPKAVWDEEGKKQYEVGVDHCIIYKYNSTSHKWEGVPWNGITNITEKPTGAEETELWADNIKYGSLRAAEKFEGTVEAYMWPDEFETCDGYGTLGSSGNLAKIKVSQQTREVFCLFYRNKIANDVNPEAGFRYHLVYGATCSPSEKSHDTVNNNPDVATFSWDFTTVPVAVPDMKPTAHIMFDSTDFSTTAEQEVLAELLATLEGVDADAEHNIADAVPTMPTPEQLKTLLAA